MTIHRRQAFTLLEVMISLAIFSLMMSLVTQSLVSGVKLQETVTGTTDLDDESNRVIQKIAGYLRTADYNYIYVLDAGNGNVTCTFALCTGIDRNGPVINQKKLRLLYNKAGKSLTATLYDTSASETNEGTWVSLEQVVATDLAGTDGLKIEQLGLDTTYVRGNRLKISMTVNQTLRDGSVLAKTSSTTIYLRSTMYFHDTLLSSATDGSSNPLPIGQTTPTTPTTPSTTTNDVSTTQTVVDTSVANKAVIALGPDTDNSVNTTNSGSNLIVVINASLQANAQSGTSITNMTVTGYGGTGNALTVTNIGTNSYKVTGYTIGAATISVTVTSKKGNTDYVSTATRQY
jgi:prepilin-type N-terminal cleavage/methylation domain-containing protein